MHMSEYLHKSSIGPVEPKDFVKDYGEAGFVLENGTPPPTMRCGSARP